MKLTKVCLEFTEEELSAMQYAMTIGIGVYHQTKKERCTDKWIDIASDISKTLPTNLRLCDLKMV